MRFIVPGNPVPYQRAASKKGGGRYTPQRSRAFRERVQVYALKAKVRRLTGPLVLTLHFYRADERRVDIDNLTKQIADALNGIAWHDDEQITQLMAQKAIDRAYPRTEVCIERIP
jgi:crossover junction endodeoxyribonuclease RusA